MKISRVKRVAKESAHLVTNKMNNFKFTLKSVKKPFDMDVLIYVDINRKEKKVIRRQLEIDLSLDNVE